MIKHLLTFLMGLASCSTLAQNVDILITNGKLLDGTGNPWVYGNIAIQGDKILKVGDTSGITATKVIDAEGLYVVPGFIDTHSHAADALASEDRSDVPGLLSQGITTAILNPDGGGAADLPRQAEVLLKDGLGVNAGLFIGHGAVRRAVLNMDDRLASDAEMDAMRQIVRDAMEFGAFGLSSGTFYAPGSYSNNAELIELGKVVAEYGGAYNSHIRDESNYTIGLQASVEEVIDVGRQAGIPAVITHIKALGPPVWGQAEAVVKTIAAAREEGVQVFTDQYPYIASQTSLDSALVPRWAMAGGREALMRRFNTPEDLEKIRGEMEQNLGRRGGADRLQFSRSSATPEIIGFTLQEWADKQEQDVITATIELVKKGRPGVVSFNMVDDDIAIFMRQPWNITASDGSYPEWGVGAPHPRAFGSFPRKINTYVKKDKVVSLENAIRSMTTLPAQVYDVTDRGQLVAGKVADVVVFDLDRIKDNATFLEPWQLSEGVVHVLVNGQVAWENEEATGVKAGKLLKH